MENRHIGTVGWLVGVGIGVFAAACGGSGETAASSSNTSEGFGGKAAGGGGASDTSSSVMQLTTSSSGQGGSGGAGGAGGAGGVHTNYPCSGCMAFPGTNAPTCDAATLAPAVLAYPTDGVLLPPNMNVLEVQFVPPAGATLFEVDFQNAITDVRVETTCVPVPDVRMGASKGCAITLPQAAWNDIAHTNRDGDPVKVTVRSTADGACVTASEAHVRLNFAKEDLAGGIYYWQSAVYGGIGGKTGGIYSHDFGTFDPTPTPFFTSGDNGTCVGCHNVSRDGQRMALADDDPDADDEFGDVHTHVLDIPTRSVLGGANMSPGFQTFTHDHGRMVASTYKTQAKNKGFDVFDGDGATHLATALTPGGFQVTQPDLSRDDGSLVFVAPQVGTISNAGDHHFFGGTLYTAPFDAVANTMGTPKVLLQGDANHNFYYPSFSPDGAWVVFDEADGGDSFYSTIARVKLARVGDATPHAIDLPALNLADRMSNSWPRWSPFVQTYKGHKILWVTFSSNRDYGLRLGNQQNPDPAAPGPFPNCYPPESPSYDQPQPLSKQGVGYEGCAQPQIWMAAIVIDEDPALDAGDRSFPAFWLPFQDVNSHNHAAQWVEAVPSGSSGAGGGGGGGVGGSGAGGSGAGGAPACGGLSAACGAGATCCTDYVCCLGACTPLNQCIH